MTDEWAEFESADNVPTSRVNDEWSEFVPASQKDTTWRDRLATVTETGVGGAIEGTGANTSLASISYPQNLGFHLDGKISIETK
ncbi:MAG: hypothetical protein R6U85_06720 [Salinivirgaceae bacterium]